VSLIKGKGDKKAVSPTKDFAKIQAQVALLKGETPPFVLVFIKPRSANWPVVLEVCQKFSYYTEKNGVVFAAFDNSLCALKALNNIFQMIAGWASALLFVDGEQERLHRMAWTDCYIRSIHAVSRGAYCLKPSYAPFSSDAAHHFISPCRLISVYNVTERHPASLVDQVQALGVESGCFRCPNFNASNFKAY
jgi:hypothetical protein